MIITRNLRLSVYMEKLLLSLPREKQFLWFYYHCCYCWCYYYLNIYSLSQQQRCVVRPQRRSSLCRHWNFTPFLPIYWFIFVIFCAEIIWTIIRLCESTTKIINFQLNSELQPMQSSKNTLEIMSKTNHFFQTHLFLGKYILLYVRLHWTGTLVWHGDK